jgi:hypothetical protein
MPPFTFSWELGGSIASLLGTGVGFLIRVFLKAGFLGGRLAFEELTFLDVPLAKETPLDDDGVPPSAFLPKKLWIVR